jgi:hypothetical protein
MNADLSCARSEGVAQRRVLVFLTALCTLLLLVIVTATADLDILGAAVAPHRTAADAKVTAAPPVTSRNGRPKFKGLVLQQNEREPYSFWSPKGWHCGPLGDGDTGVLCSPTVENEGTFFSVRVTPLATAPAAGDVSTLEAGLQAGLGQLPALRVESADTSITKSRITLERVYTYREGPHTRKRRVRLIYDQDRLYTVLSQGATEEEYDYWLAMLNYSHSTFGTSLFCM